jgi:4'-phosphopantetheinyl transferase
MVSLEFEIFNNPPIKWFGYWPQNLLKSDVAHVFKIHCSFYGQIEKKISTVLTEAEMEKMNRFFKKSGAVRFALTKYFLRQILSEQLHQKPRDINFLLTDAYKPYLPEINFNISHSGDYVVIAINKENIGIDVELIKNNFDYKPLADVCFTPKERKLITNLTDFYKFWTRKEAILKASGEGLIDDLQEIECIAEQVQRQKNTYKLKSMMIDNVHFLSIAHVNSVEQIHFWNLAL